MHLVWHVTAARNALSIRRHGLLARDPADHNHYGSEYWEC